MFLAQINAVLREIKGTSLLNQEITRQEASVITARRAARTKRITCIVYNILSSLYILRRTHAEEQLEMDLSSFALRLYEAEILIHVQATANVRNRCAIEVKSHDVSAVFKHRDST